MRATSTPGATNPVQEIVTRWVIPEAGTAAEASAQRAACSASGTDRAA